jgi:hypothetical protein
MTQSACLFVELAQNAWKDVKLNDFSTNRVAKNEHLHPDSPKKSAT